MLSYYRLQVPIRAGKVKVWSELTIPSGADMIVIIPMALNAFCEGESTVAIERYFQQKGWGTLVVPLVPEFEFGGLQVRPDDKLLTERLIAVTNWLTGRDILRQYRLGYCGSDLVARAVLMAAAHFGDRICTVISRGGCFGDSDNWLRKVEAPTLLVTGSRDEAVLEMNWKALGWLNGLSQMKVIDGASHNFSLDKMKKFGDLASRWIAAHLTRAPAALSVC